MIYTKKNGLKVCYNQLHNLWYVGVNVMACRGGLYIICSPLFPTMEEATEYRDYKVSLHPDVYEAHL